MPPFRSSSGLVAQGFSPGSQAVKGQQNQRALALGLSLAAARAPQYPWSGRNAVTWFFTKVTAIGWSRFQYTTSRLPYSLLSLLDTWPSDSPTWRSLIPRIAWCESIACQTWGPQYPYRVCGLS